MDGTLSEKESISLVIKTPNQAHGDQLIQDVNVNWTVKDLKTHLANVYPSKPAERDQKLIYSGKLLSDQLHLKEVLRMTDGVPALHLVLAFKPSQLGARPKVRQAEQQQSSQSLVTEPSAPSVPSASSNIRQRGHSVPTVPTATDTGFSTSTPRTTAEVMNPANFPNYSLYSPQQLMWLQHMYARQYYMQYQAAMAAAASAPVTTPITAQQPAVTAAALPNQAPIDNLPANQNAPDPAFINPEGANQNLRMNAQGGAVMEDEEDVERDWLDWVYTASRAAVFLSIVYFYSNLTRFVLVMSSLLLMYLHTAGWFPFRHRAQAQPPNQPAPEVLQNQQNQNQDRQEQVAPPAGTEDNEVEGDAGVQQNETPAALSAARAPVLWTVWVFFKAFFASLIPEAPGAVAN